MRTLEQLVTRSRSSLDEMLPLLKTTVDQNSFSRSAANNALVAEQFAAALGTIPGVEVDLVPSREHGPHLVARTRAARDGARGALTLIGHHDTVFPPDTFEGFVREGDIARGPGTLDMKGGLCVAVQALRILAEAGVLAELPVRFVSVSDEEIGSPDGKRVLAEHLEGAGAALVFEAGRAEDRIITARKGSGSLRVRATGLAAHAGNHHQAGKNAIWSLARFIERAQGLTDYNRGITVNVGTISGGTTRNTVPAEAVAEVDLRFLTTEDGEQLVATLKALAADPLEGTVIDVYGGVSRPPLVRDDNNVALFEEYARAAVRSGLGGEECPLVGGGSDASTAAALGVAAIDGLGPRGRGFHTHDEYIELSSLPLRVEALVRFLAARAGLGA